MDGAPLVPGINTFIAEADMESVLKKIDISVLGETVELTVSLWQTWKSVISLLRLMSINIIILTIKHQWTYGST